MATAAHNGPILHLPISATKVLLARGEIETAEYKRQHSQMLAALYRSVAAQAKPSVVRALVCTGRNHFDLPLGLGDPNEQLGQALRHQMRPGERR